MLSTLGTILLFLICPLMMIFMMKGMHGGHEQHASPEKAHKKFHSKEEELADMGEQLQNLQRQYDRLAEDIKDQPESQKKADRYKEVHF